MRLFKRKKQPTNSLANESLKDRLPDVAPEVLEIIEQVRGFTMTSPERIAALCHGIDHIDRLGIPGAIVECGVWRGGSMMAVAKRLLQHEHASRDLWLYDTFEGMTQPTTADVDFLGRDAQALLEVENRSDPKSIWCYSQLDQVKAAINSTGYPSTLVHYIQGPVESTLPAEAPQQIALLRLDTDWYESTRHELIHLFPRLAPGGVLIVDDYGHWERCRRAVDEYFTEHRIHMFLSRIDYTGRMGIHYPSNLLTNVA